MTKNPGVIGLKMSCPLPLLAFFGKLLALSILVTLTECQPTLVEYKVGKNAAVISNLWDPLIRGAYKKKNVNTPEARSSWRKKYLVRRGVGMRLERQLIAQPCIPPASI